MTNFEKPTYEQGELLTFRDILEDFEPETLYELITDAIERKKSSMDEILELNHIISLAKSILNDKGDDFDQMRVRAEALKGE